MRKGVQSTWICQSLRISSFLESTVATGYRLLWGGFSYCVYSKMLKTIFPVCSHQGAICEWVATAAGCAGTCPAWSVSSVTPVPHGRGWGRESNAQLEGGRRWHCCRNISSQTPIRQPARSQPCRGFWLQKL